MNKKQFIQQASIQMIMHPDVISMDKSVRLDAAIAFSECLWDKLNDRGYGSSKEKDPNEKRNWYLELDDEQVIAFDKAWRVYKKHGVRMEAAKAWAVIDRKEYEHIIKAIPKYLEQCELKGVSVAHFATFLNKRYWDSFDVFEKPKIHVDPVTDKVSEIKSLERMISHTKDPNSKKMLEEQLKRLKHGDDT